MNIQRINYKFTTAAKENYESKVNLPRFFLPVLKSDTFVENDSSKISFGHVQKIAKRLPKMFNEFNAVTHENIAKLSTQERKKLSDFAIGYINKHKKNFLFGNDFLLEELVEDAVRATRILKQNLDAKFGIQKYVFVSIGRSPSFLSETLNSMGVETSICPISGLNELLGGIKKLLENENLEKYFEYLKKIGLNPDKIKDSKKTYVFTDYFDSGLSLENFKKLLIYNNRYKMPNVIFTSLQELLLPDQKGEEMNFIEYFISRYLEKMVLKNFSPSFHLPYDSIHLVENFTESEKKHFSLQYFNMLKFLVLEKIQNQSGF